MVYGVYPEMVWRVPRCRRSPLLGTLVQERDVPVGLGAVPPLPGPGMNVSRRDLGAWARAWQAPKGKMCSIRRKIHPTQSNNDATEV